MTDLSSVSARQRTPNGMGWPSYKTHHDLINQNRFFCQVLIIKETRGRRWPPLPPSICQSLTADTRGSASRRHTVTASYRRSCTPSPAPQGNVNKGRFVVSRLTSPPAIATDTASSLTGLACLIDCPPKRSQPTRNNIGKEGGQRPLCYSDDTPVSVIGDQEDRRLSVKSMGRGPPSSAPTNTAVAET